MLYFRHCLKDILSHFSHPFLGTYEVHQFLDLGYLEGTHSGVVYELHTNTMVPWNGKPIPYPTHTNTMLPYHTNTMSPYHTRWYDVTSYHHTKADIGCLGSFSKIYKLFLQAAILVHWVPFFVGWFSRFFLRY